MPTNPFGTGVPLPPGHGQIGWRRFVVRAYLPAFPPPTNYDWPNPRLPGFNPEFRTWIEEGNTLPPFGGIGPPNAINYDWPNPQRAAVRCIDLLTWAQAGNAPVPNVIARAGLYTAIIPPRFNPELRTFAGPGNNLSPPPVVAALPPNNYDWPNPRPPDFSAELRTFARTGNNLPPFGGIAPAIATNLDWPNPRGPGFNPELRTFAIAGNAATARPGPNLDWPNPRGAVPAVTLKTWLNATALQLIGQDQFFGAPGQVATSDFPNPIARPPRDLSWLAQFNIQLQTIAAAPFVQTDWPNPRGAGGIIDLRTWIAPDRLNLLGLDTFFGAPGQPPANLDWPNPRGAILAVELRTFAAGIAEVNLPTVIYPATFGLFDWPNPRGPIPAIALRTWTDPSRVWLIGQDQFFGAPGEPPARLDWQNPRGAVSPIDLRTWSPAFAQLLALAPAPFGLTDWPNPRGPVVVIDLRTWIDPVKAVLTAQPGPNLDWPNPRGPIPAIALRTWSDPTRVWLIGQDRFVGAPGQPPANLDWPNPRGPVAAVDLRTFLQGYNSVRPSLIVAVPFFNYDWPNPRGPVHAIDLRTWSVPLASGVLVPFGGFFRAFGGQRDRIDAGGSRDRSGSTGSRDRTGVTGQRDRAGIAGSKPRTDEPGQVD